MYQLTPFSNIPLDDDFLEHLINQHETLTLPRLQRLWRYFRNELARPTIDGGSTGSPAQHTGLPPRLTNRRSTIDDRFEREIVIENDIGWRIQTLVDFMFPKAPQIVSRARDARTRDVIEQVLDRVLQDNGGVTLWQDAALLGSVYGQVDLLVSCDDLFDRSSVPSTSNTQTTTLGTGNRAGESASDPFNRSGPFGFDIPLRIEAVEAPRAIPLCSEHDFRLLDALILHYNRPSHGVEQKSMLSRILSRGFTGRVGGGTTRSIVTITQIHTATHCQSYENGRLVNESRNRLGRVPVVHIQNLSQPFCWEGLSDVEPLIPLQDELNTRLCDRANRVTMQSFRMWLGKGIDGFTDRPIGPGQMWMTDNENASIEGFGGDADSPSERQHIEELREALDKASGVTPAAAGHIKAKIGNLTSENALRISLMGTLAKVKRKRITYGRGIAELCELVLHALNVSGHLRTDPADREIDIAWPDPLPTDESRKIQDALAKVELGIPAGVLRAELGYGDA